MGPGKRNCPRRTRRAERRPDARRHRPARGGLLLRRLPKGRFEGSPDRSARSRIDPNPTAPWELKFPEGWGAPASVELADLKPWKDLDISPEGKAFSGTAEYNSAFEIGPVKKNRHYILDLGDVERIAEVYVNGEFVRTLWTPPYSLDITDRVRDGKNSITVKVTNTWFNRLVYDAARPESDRKTWVLKWPDQNAPLKESGLLGPVSIRTMQ